MKKLCSKRHKTFIEETSSVNKCANFSEKGYLYYRIYTNIDRVELFHVLLKFDLLMRSSYQYMYQYIYNRQCGSKDEIFLSRIKLRLNFLFIDLSQKFGKYLMVFAPKFFIHGHAGR